MGTGAERVTFLGKNFSEPQNSYFLLGLLFTKSRIRALLGPLKHWRQEPPSSPALPRAPARAIPARSATDARNLPRKGQPPAGPQQHPRQSARDYAWPGQHIDTWRGLQAPLLKKGFADEFVLNTGNITRVHKSVRTEGLHPVAKAHTNETRLLRIHFAYVKPSITGTYLSFTDVSRTSSFRTRHQSAAYETKPFEASESSSCSQRVQADRPAWVLHQLLKLNPSKSSVTIRPRLLTKRFSFILAAAVNGPSVLKRMRLQ